METSSHFIARTAPEACLAKRMHGHHSGSRAERARLLQKRRSKDDAGGKTWTHKELRALEDGLVALGAGRAGELREQVLANARAEKSFDAEDHALAATASCGASEGQPAGSGCRNL